MRRINLFTDLACTIPYGQFVTQDWNTQEELTTAHSDTDSIYVESKKQSFDSIDNPVYAQAAIGIEKGAEYTTPSPSVTSISGSTIPFPLGDVEELSGQDTPTTHKLYIDGGILLEYQYYHFNETDTYGIMIKTPQYFTGYDENEQPVFVSVNIPGPSGGGRYWLGTPNKGLNSQQVFTFSSETWQNPVVVFFEAPVKFKKTTTIPEPAFSVTEQAFIPMLLAYKNGVLETLSGDAWEFGGGYPSALTINSLNSDEVVPEPEEDQTSTGNNVFQDGLGEGLGVSDPAEHISISDRNRAFGWGGNGVGLTYYKITPSDLAKVVSEVWGGIFNMSSIMNTDVIRNCIVGAFALPIGITGDTATTTVWIGNVPVNTNDTTYYITSSRLVEGTTSPLVPSERFTEDGWGDFNDFLNSTATLYLPFVGSINIDISAIARGTISVEIAIDQYNGNIAYWVYTTSMQAPNQVPILYGCYTGNCAVEMPISGFGYSGNLLQKVLNTGSQISSGVSQIGSGIGGIATGNIAGGASSAQAGGLNALAAIRGQIVDLFSKSVTNRGGIIDPMSACVSPYNVTLQIRRARPLRSDTTRHIEGIPSATKMRMRELSGYVEVKACDINTLTCNEKDREEILALLKEGVYI